MDEGRDGTVVSFAGRALLSGEAFRVWLATARHGEQVAYFAGYLARAPRPPEVSLEARAAARRGEAMLVQRREGPFRWTYIAVRLRPARQGATWWRA